MAASPHDTLIATLRDRFSKNMRRHAGVTWSTVDAKLAANPRKLAILARMEETGGEPDVVSLGDRKGSIIFVDCAAQSPVGRRSLCYDRAALDGRKENKPGGAAVEMAGKMGIELLSESQYRALQEVGEFDLKTSNWIATPQAIRALGGALFCDRRYDHVFTYHNGAESYYAARGFRGRLEI